MKLRLKEEPREWRKSTLLTALALAVLSSVLCWRRGISFPAWRVLLVMLGGVGLAGWLQPRWFRGYYRVSTRLGFWLSQVIARVVLTLMFVILITPLGLLLRIFGKDLLRLKRTQQPTYWGPAKQGGSLDQLF